MEKNGVLITREHLVSQEAQAGCDREAAIEVSRGVSQNDISSLHQPRVTIAPAAAIEGFRAWAVERIGEGGRYINPSSSQQLQVCAQDVLSQLNQQLQVLRSY